MSNPFYVPPEQLVKDRAEFARKGIGRGRAIVAMQYADGLLLLAENHSSTLFKISEIYDSIAFAGVGRFNEFELLRVAGIRHADLRGYMYARADVQAKALANAFAQTLGNIFTHEVKPYEVEVLVAELGGSAGEDRLYRVMYDGTLVEEVGTAAIGGPAEALSDYVRADHDPNQTFDEALKKAQAAFTEVQGGSPSDWEGAVLERGGERRSFRRLEL
jgi:proteasome alpha subunit